MKISITTKGLLDILENGLEYSKEEIEEMSLEEKLDKFIGAGYFENEDDFGGIIEVPTEGFIDFEIVSSVTGQPVSLDEYLKMTNKVNGSKNSI